MCNTSGFLANAFVARRIEGVHRRDGAERRAARYHKPAVDMGTDGQLTGDGSALRMSNV